MTDTIIIKAGTGIITSRDEMDTHLPLQSGKGSVDKAALSTEPDPTPLRLTIQIPQAISVFCIVFNAQKELV